MYVQDGTRYMYYLTILTYMGSTTSQLAWVEDDTDNIKVSISPDIAVEVRELADNMDKSMSQSLILGAAVQDAADNDELARIEAYLDERLKAEGVAPALLTREKNEKSVSEWQSEDLYRFRAKLPVGIVDMIDDNAPSTRRKGWWATNALITYLESPFESRFTRVETKRQVLTLLEEGNVPDEEMTGVLKRMRDGSLFSGAAERVFGDGVGGVVTDIAAVDWSEPNNVVLDMSFKDMDLTKVAQVYEYKARAILAWARSKETIYYNNINSLINAKCNFNSSTTIWKLKRAAWEMCLEDDEVVCAVDAEWLYEHGNEVVRMSSKTWEQLQDETGSDIVELYRKIEVLG